MPEYTKETVTTNENANDQDTRRPIQERASTSQTVNYIVYFIFGVLDVLLAFRFVFKLFGANPSTGFVDFIYSLSAIFVAPFENIFNISVQKGDVVASVFEPATLVAIVVYALIAWGIVTLVRAISGRQED